MSHSHHHHEIDFKTAFTVEKLAGSMVKITGEIPFSELQAERAGALKSLGQNVKLDGFRPGHIPESVLVKTIGEMNILAEMAERAIAHMYPHILEEHDIDAIGYPKIEITKIAPENPLGFTATVAVIPEITLPDYKALAKVVNENKESTEVGDADVEKQVADILRKKVAYDRLQAKASAQTEAGTTSEVIEAETPTEEEAFDPENIKIPELTDEIAMTLGQPGQFTGAEDFRAKVREHLAN